MKNIDTGMKMLISEINAGIKTDIPQYIINKLSLNRDPISGNI